MISNASERIVLVITAILSVPGIIRWIPIKPQAPNIKQAPSFKHQISSAQTVSVWDLEFEICLTFWI
jgi:phage tail protein X